MNKRKICIITGTRAEYGLLYWLMKEIQEDVDLELQIIATGMHLSSEFGLTYQQIEKDGFEIDKKIETLLSSDTEESISKAIGLGCLNFPQAYQDLNPDFVVILGDRFELLPAAISAMIFKIPIAHIHGGEITEGVIDEQIRHALTKFSSLHFPTTKEYAQRIIQLGEQPDKVFNFGMPGLDNIYKLDLLSKAELEKKLGVDFNYKTAIITYHPVTLENNTVKRQIQNLLSAVEEFDLNIIFTKANADTHGRIINHKIKNFVEKNPAKYKFFDNLGQIIYLSVLKHADIMIGNSSSGFTEAPSFKIPVINIGDRQKGRIKADNIIDCGYSTKKIKDAIEQGLSKKFKKEFENCTNPYDKYEDGQTSLRIKNILKNVKINESLIKKEFYDLENFN